MVLVPDVDHAVEPLVAGLHGVAVEQVVPELGEFGKRLVNFLHGIELSNGLLGSYLIYKGTVEVAKRGNQSGRLPGIFLFLRLLHVAQHEDEILLLAGLQFHLDVVRGDGAPSVGHRVAGTAFHHGVGIGKLVVESDERLAVGVESLNGNVHAIVGIVVAALLVFGLVIDDGAVNLNLARREVALEVLHVGGSVPEAPLGEREQL